LNKILHFRIQEIRKRLAKNDLAEENGTRVKEIKLKTEDEFDHRK